MTLTVNPENQESIYLGRFSDEWLAEFISGSYVEKMDPICEALVSRFGWEIAIDFGIGRAYSLDDEEYFNLVCHALSCFGEAFLKKAIDSLPLADERKQTRLVSSMGHMGVVAVDCLMQLLKNSSATLRAAACLGIKEAFYSGRLEESPATMQWKLAFLEGPDLSPEALDVFFEKMDALQSSEERKLIVSAGIIAALLEGLADDYQAVRLAAIYTLDGMLRACTIEPAAKQLVLAGLLPRLEDEHQTVRMAAMETLELLEVPKSRLKSEDARLFDLLYYAEDYNATEKALGELACNNEQEHLRSLLNDPCPLVREQIVKTLSRDGLQNLGQREIRHLIQVVKNADPVVGPGAVVREEAIHVFQGLAAQWEYEKENGNEEQTPTQDDRKATHSLSRMQAEIDRLTEVPFDEVIGALHGRDVGLRIAAVEALFPIYKNGREVLGYIREMADDPCREVRLRVQQLVRRMVKDKSGAPEKHYGPR